VIFIPLREPKYKRNVAIVKRYGNTHLRLSLHQTLRTKGLDCPNKHPPGKGSVNEEKLDESISRTKSRLYEYALCNPWDWFVNFTLDPVKYDRHDLKRYCKDLAQWIRNYNRLRNTNIKYLFVPERHKDGAWHIHGFICGLPPDHLTPFTLEDHLPYKLRKKLAANHAVYNWEAYAKKFGYCDIEPIRNPEAAKKYILKYITKDLSRCVSELNAHMFYASQGLNKAETVKQGILIEKFTDIAPIDYENDYVTVSWLPNDEKTLKRLTDSVITEREKAARAATQTASPIDYENDYVPVGT